MRDEKGTTQRLGITSLGCVTCKHARTMYDVCSKVWHREQTRVHYGTERTNETIVRVNGVRESSDAHMETRTLMNDYSTVSPLTPVEIVSRETELRHSHSGTCTYQV